MARLWTSGFELNTTTAGVEWTNSTGSPTIQTTTVRSGTYALQLTSLSSGTRKGIYYRYNGSATTIYTRTYIRIGTLPSAENRIISFSATTPFPGGHIVYLSIDNTGAVRLYDEDGVIGSPSSALSTNTWYYIETQTTRSGAGGTHIVRAKIDGTEFAGSTTRDLSTNPLFYILGANLNAEAQTTGNWYFDDVAINDSSGSFQNSYPGEGEVIVLRPNVAGDTATWPDGTSTLFSAVDEITPNDLTDYIGAEDTVDAGTTTSEFNLDATPSAIESYETINCVQVGVRYRNEDTGSSGAFKLRIKATSGGTVEESANIATTLTTWSTNANAVPLNYPLTLYDLPGASTTAWTKSDLDTAQIGVNVAVDPGLDMMQVSALWLVVDHKPGVAPPLATGSNLLMMGI